MQHLEVSCAVRRFFKSLGFKGLIYSFLFFDSKSEFPHLLPTFPISCLDPTSWWRQVLSPKRRCKIWRLKFQQTIIFMFTGTELTIWYYLSFFRMFCPPHFPLFAAFAFPLDCGPSKGHINTTGLLPIPVKLLNITYDIILKLVLATIIIVENQ